MNQNHNEKRKIQFKVSENALKCGKVAIKDISRTSKTLRFRPKSSGSPKGDHEENSLMKCSEDNTVRWT